MYKYIKGSMRVLTDYLISLLTFGIFLYAFLSITKENFNAWLPLYCYINFALLGLLLYSDMKTIATKEKRPQYNLNPYPFKGLVLGIIGVIPLYILELIYPLISFNNEIYSRIKHLVLNTLLGPLYGFIRLGGESTAAYFLAVLTVPVLAMLGYLAGFYGFEIGKYIKVFNAPKPQKKGPPKG